MLIEDQKLPGRSRVKDVVINGELLNRVFNVDATESKSCSQVWATGKYTQLHLGSYENPDLKTIECLNDFENIKKIHIMLNHKVDISPLDRHANTLIEYFCNDDCNPIVNCEKYLNLRSLGQIWHPKMTFASSHPQLHRLSLVKYCPKEKDLGVLPMAPNLEFLDLLRSCIKTLDGIEKYDRLEKIVITWGKYLTEVGSLAGCQNLKMFELEGCKNIIDLEETLRKFVRLERLVLMKVPDLNNIRFIERMPNLRWLNLIDTNVIDGDMNPLLRHPSLEYVVFTSKKHFNHSEAQIREALREKKNG